MGCGTSGEGGGRGVRTTIVKEGQTSADKLPKIYFLFKVLLTLSYDLKPHTNE